MAKQKQCRLKSCKNRVADMTILLQRKDQQLDKAYQAIEQLKRNHQDEINTIKSRNEVIKSRNEVLKSIGQIVDAAAHAITSGGNQ